MTFMFRYGSRHDFGACINLLKAEDNFRSSGEIFRQLEHFWQRSLSSENMHFAVIENIEPRKAQAIQGFGISMAVSDEFAIRLRSGAGAFSAQRIYGEPPLAKGSVLSHREIARSNARDGINLLIVHCVLGHQQAEDPCFAPLMAAALNSFNFLHRGYHLKSILWEVQGLHMAEILSAQGYRLIDNFSGQADIMAMPENQRPFLMGLFREDVAYMDYAPEPLPIRQNKPVLELTSGQQRLLRYALLEMDDREIAQLFDISQNAIKQTWRGIFDKARLRFPVSASQHDAASNSPRRTILNYVRQHMEELRPYELR